MRKQKEDQLVYAPISIAFCSKTLAKHLPDLIHDVMVEKRLTEG